METILKNKWIIGGLIVLIFAIIGIKALNAPAQTPEQQFNTELYSATHDIDRAVEAEVKKQLSFPDEASFKNESNFTIVDLSQKKAGYRGEVSTKNAFGVQKTHRYEALITLFNGQITVEKVTIQE